MHKSGSGITQEDYNVQDVSAYVRCFFKNRFAKATPDDLSDDCLKSSSISAADVKTCSSTDDDVNAIKDFMKGKTQAIAAEIADTGLSVRINGNRDEDAATKNLLKSVCTALVSF